MPASCGSSCWNGDGLYGVELTTIAALAGDRNLSTPARQSPAAAEIVVKTIVTHTVTYFVAGVLAYSLLDYPRLISGSTLGVLMRPLRDPMVVAGPLFQPIRGLLFGVMFYLLRQTFFGRRDGWFLMWAVLVVVGIVGPFGAPPGSLEGLIYTTVPVSVQLTFLPEVLAQSLALSWLLVSWVKRPERWLNWIMGVAFVMTDAPAYPGFADDDTMSSGRRWSVRRGRAACR